MEKPKDEVVEQMTPDELLVKMSEISQGYQTDRSEYTKASKAWHQKQRETRLFLAFGLPERLKNPKSLEFAKEVKTKKLLADDIKALIELECEEEYENYQLYKHACETSEEAFKMFQAQLSYHQTLLRVENEANRFLT